MRQDPLINDEPGVECEWVKMVDSMAPEGDLVMSFKGQCIDSCRVLGFGFRRVGEKEKGEGHWTSPACTWTGIPPSAFCHRLPTTLHFHLHLLHLFHFFPPLNPPHTHDLQRAW